MYITAQADKKPVKGRKIAEYLTTDGKQVSWTMWIIRTDKGDIVHIDPGTITAIE